jgi:uncharacterized membrane protein (UPF0127 family)
MRASAWTRAVPLALTCLLPGGAALAEACAPGVADLRVGGSEVRFRVEVMDSAEERARGLMFRESLPRFEGMLFVYDAPGPVAFWMRNTLIPLDMLFFDPAGRLSHVHANARPLDETPIPGGDNVLYVLEVNAGLAASLGIEPGSELRHPAVDQAQAAWPCDE